MRYDSLKIGGVLYVIAVFQFFVFELVALDQLRIAGIINSKDFGIFSFF